MTRFRCLSCDGEYSPDQPGGYKHVCPPYRLVKKGPGGPNIEPGDPGEYKDVTKLSQYEPIKSPRDENVDDSVPDKPKPCKKEGKGRELILTVETLPT